MMPVDLSRPSVVGFMASRYTRKELLLKKILIEYSKEPSIRVCSPKKTIIGKIKNYLRNITII